MNWFGKSSKVVESKDDMERLGIRLETIKFNHDRNEYELLIHLPGCPKDLIKLNYVKPSGVLKLQGKMQKTEFLHRFPIPTDSSPTRIYARFRGDVLHIIMPRSFCDRKDASSKQEDDQQASSDRKSTEQVGEDRENLPARVPESLPSHQKSTDEMTGEAGKGRGKSPASVLEPSSSDQKSTEKLTERGKDHEKLSDRVLSSLPQSDQVTTEKLRQPSVRKSSSSVKELAENYQKNISKTSELPPPPPPPPTPRRAAPAPWNRKAKNIGSRKEEVKDSSDQTNDKKRDNPENSVVNSESKLREEVSKNVEITLDEQGRSKWEKKGNNKSNPKDDKNEKTGVRKFGEKDVKNEKMENESKPREDAKNDKIVSKVKEDEREKKKDSAKGKGTLGMVVEKVKETGKTAVAAAKKEENRPMVIVGAAVLVLLVIGASLRKKPKN
ncbi:hypothetical protein IC575_006501 [Cucumis melo]|uniref:Uncharacterized protein LOC103496529 isoform X1 n=2 Tax=Cucumis melo TaxID=3656 RepID=A0A1S3C3S5_CUCME|nr:uncharacterized protein LOC103496529 isoform X1 [Cucumis melo]